MTNNYNDEPIVEIVKIGEGNERIISSINGDDIGRISPKKIIDWLNEYGVIILRNFNVNKNTFSSIVKDSSHRVTVDPARSFVSKHAQLVDAGTESVGLHCENGNAPILPHILWFNCAIAAKKGSQTTYCDGQRVWEKLPTKLKDEFLSNNIMYKRTIESSLWKKYVFHESGKFEHPEDVKYEDLLNIAKNNSGQRFELKENGDVFSSLSIPAVHASYFSDKLSFANSLLGPSYNYQTPVITFEDGREIEDDLWKVIIEVTQDCTDEIDWKNGDIAVIDNTRYMHGRRRIEDTNRVIYAALSYMEKERYEY